MPDHTEHSAAGHRMKSNRKPRTPRSHRKEDGFTLVEMSIAMLVMSILMTMVVAGMIHLVNPMLQTQSIRNSSDQLDIAFFDLDSEVRYAYEIWAPYAGTPSTDNNWDIEFESTFNGGAEPTCTELQYNFTSGQLLQAMWTTGQATTPPFKMIANGLTGSADPFVIISNPAYQEVQLMVTLSASSGTANAKETTSSTVTFTALNSASNQQGAIPDTDCGSSTAPWTTA